MTELVNHGLLDVGGAGAAGAVTVNGPFTQTATGTLNLELSTSGSGSDRLTVAGVVTLGGSLNATTLPGFAGGPFTILDNTGPGPVVGFFAGLPEGTAFSLGDWLYQISYLGGTGNDVVLLPLSVSAGQWANAVLGFSSEFGPSPGNWSAAQALGAPNTFAYGDFPTAWAPSSINGTLEYLTLGFATPIYATGVTIRETYGNGFVYRVDLMDVNNVLYPIWTGTDPSQPGSPAEFTIAFPAVPYLVKGVRIYTNTDRDPNAWEEIDAVMLHGNTTSESLGSSAAMSSSSAPLAVLSSTHISQVRRANVGPFATFTVSGPVSLGAPVTFVFSSPRDRLGPVPASRFRYSFDFNNDGDFTDPGESANGTSPSASYTFTTRGWHMVRGRVRNEEGLFTDFWTRVFVP